MQKDLDNKHSVMQEFIDRLQKSEVGGDITRIVHYGSTLRGDWNEESDVDLLIVATGDLRGIREVCLDLSFELMLSRGELVQPMVYCPDEYRNPNYFLYCVRKTGKEIFRDGARKAGSGRSDGAEQGNG